MKAFDQMSLMIPTFNRGAYLERSLARLSELTLPDQLVVVNDGGEDDCSQIVADFGVRTGVPASIVHRDSPRRTVPSAARNLGLQLCDHPWVLTSEPEVSFQTDVIAQLKGMDSYLRRRYVIVAGTVFYVPQDWDGSTDIPRDTPKCEGWISAYSMLFHRDWVADIGGWDEGFPAHWGGEGIDLVMRLEETGVGRHVAEELRVIHQDHGTSDPALNMLAARANTSYLWRKPYTHGREEHRCSRECLEARGVIARV